jgi:SRSO17 transposase
MAAEHSVSPQRWLAALDDLLTRVGDRVQRVEPRRRLRQFVVGMMAGLPRVNCWTLSEHVGENHPRGMQRFLSEAVWDSEGLLEDVRDWALSRLGERDATLVIDETGDLKKGSHTVGVQRQYTGTAGRIENAQVAVYLTYASSAGHCLMDRALYLPKSWAGDDTRRDAAGVPEQVGFATKPALAAEMITKAYAAGVPAAWVAADEVYGADPVLRATLVTSGLGYVLAVAKSHLFMTGIGPRKAIDLAVRLPARAWHQMSAGHGSKGERWYDWALIETTDTAAEPATAASGTGEPSGRRGHHWLLIRRNRKTGEYAFYRAYSPVPVPLVRLVKVAGRRWTVEESFASSKELAALDEHQVRTWTSWHRWTALAILAHAFLSVMAADEPPPAPDSGLIPLTRNEIRHLLAEILKPVLPSGHILRWSIWRRLHQAVARACHYKRQAADLN